MAAERLPAWDLSDLYGGMDDLRIEETLADQLRRADEFARTYRDKINLPDIAADELWAAIVEYETILQELDKPLTYASLLFAADTSNPARGAFLQRMRERHSEISIRMMFFELELTQIPEEQIVRLVSEDVLGEYRHYIWAERLFREHRLSEPEEKILEEKANTGRRAFTRLFEQTTSNIAFDVGGESRTLPEVLALIRDPDRDLRRRSASSLTSGLRDNSSTLTYIFNTLIQDKATDDRLRNYVSPEQARHLSNELEPEIVELVVETAAAHYPLVARYYDLKREIMGLDRLMHYDRYAPLFATKECVPFARAREIVLSSFDRFSTVIGSAARAFFDRGWIDAEPRKGKRGGAFCSYVTPDLHPYVFVNYLNRMDDVMTLGHELGHGVHSSLASCQTYFNFASVLPVAELASTFGEMLVFETLQSRAVPGDKLALYSEKIEGTFATIFRQAAMYRFEQAIHVERRDKGELTPDRYGELWQHFQQEMFGESVELGEEHSLWWMYVPHFINSPFYVYAYTFGELLVVSLYAMYKREGDAFASKYIELLKAGGSMTPADMLSRVGIDIRDRSFWQAGMDVLSGFVDEFERLWRNR